jgi:hypothetical protein
MARRWKPRRQGVSRPKEVRGFGRKPDGSALHRELNKTPKKATPCPYEFAFITLRRKGRKRSVEFYEAVKRAFEINRTYPSWAHVPAPTEVDLVVLRCHRTSVGSDPWNPPVLMFKSRKEDGVLVWVRVRGAI